MADEINAIEAELGVNPKGSFPSVAARLGRPEALPFSRSGAIAVSAGSMRYYVPYACTLQSVKASLGVAPVGASVIVDVNKNGTTVFTTQANRPTITAGANASGVQTPDVTTLVAGDYLTIDVDQVGSTTPGTDLSVVLLVAR